MQIPSGILTTEFWATLIGDIIALLALFGVPPISNSSVQALAVLGAFVATAVYSLGRSHVKATAIRAATPPSSTVDATATAQELYRIITIAAVTQPAPPPMPTNFMQDQPDRQHADTIRLRKPLTPDTSAT